MHSVSDLTTSSHKTSGDVPPKLVGATTTVVGDKMYLFGGRLVTKRKMVSDLYVIDLHTFVWSKITPSADEHVPRARYFHSTDAWNNHLVVHGGMGTQPDSPATDNLCVLNDVRLFDLATHKWLPEPPTSSLAFSDPSPPSPSPPPEYSHSETSPTTKNVFPSASPLHTPPESQTPLIPRGRYAHLSSITAARLFIIGGQDINNNWVDDICVFDLRAQKWVQRKMYARPSGTYRSVAVSAQWGIVRPQSTSADSASAKRENGQAQDEEHGNPGLVHLPYSVEPTDANPNDIYVYSNYNFTDVKRELEVFSPLPTSTSSSTTTDFTMTDNSSSIKGISLPPGLRFPSGAICGKHLIFAGIYLSHSYQSFSIWALDLTDMTWTRIDTGTTLSTGSWAKGVLYSAPSNSPGSGTSASQSKYLIFGSRTGNLVEDYNRRLLSWEDVTVVDLEAFGIYQPPRSLLAVKSQEFGLKALEDGLFADFEVECDDGRRIRCSRKVLEGRWPWFKQSRREMGMKLKNMVGDADVRDNPESSVDSTTTATVTPPPDPWHADSDSSSTLPAPVTDPRLTPRSLNLGEPYAVTLAFLQYFYALSLITPLQHAPPVLSQLLVLSMRYELAHLRAVVQHAMHGVLGPVTSVGVYEVATVCACQSLQIRALKFVMSSNRRGTQGRNRLRTNGGSGDNGSGNGSASGHANGGDGRGYQRSSDSGNSSSAFMRPRGLSDVQSPTERSPGGGSYVSQTNGEQFEANADSLLDSKGNSTPQASSTVSRPPLSILTTRHRQQLSMDSLYRALQTVSDEMFQLSEPDSPLSTRSQRSSLDAALARRPSGSANNNAGHSPHKRTESPTPVLSRSASTPMLSSSSNITTPLTTISETSPVSSILDFCESNSLMDTPMRPVLIQSDPHSDLDNSACLVAQVARMHSPTTSPRRAHAIASPTMSDRSSSAADALRDGERWSRSSRSLTNMLGPKNGSGSGHTSASSSSGDTTRSSGASDRHGRSLGHSLSAGSLRSLFRMHRSSPLSTSSDFPITPQDSYFSSVPPTPTLPVIEERSGRDGHELPQEEYLRSYTDPSPSVNTKRRKGIPAPIVVVHPDSYHTHSPHLQPTPPFTASSFLSIDSPLSTANSSTFSLPTTPFSPGLPRSHTDSTGMLSPTTASLFDRSMIFSSSTLKAEKDALKARAKAEKLEKKAREKAQKDLMKGAKEEAKRMKKEERVRIEQRRQMLANQWIERSDGMYGDLDGLKKQQHQEQFLEGMIWRQARI